jgi:hypothetical protein
MDVQHSKERQEFLESEEYKNTRTFEGLKKNFETRYEKSQDKETLLEREIEGYELIFNAKKLPLLGDLFSDRKLLFNYSIFFTEFEIEIIRSAYQYFIVNGYEITEANGWLNLLEDIYNFDESDAICAYNDAKDLFEYLQWLKDFSKTKAKLFSIKNKQAEEIFPELLKNIPDEKKEAFAERLKKEFRNNKGLNIRYMVEGLINKEILPNLDIINKAQLYRAMNEFFDWNIGRYSGIFDPKLEEDWRQKKIESAKKRIESILKYLA